MPGSAEHQASAAIDKFTPPQVDSTISSAIPPDKMEPRPEDTVKPVNLQQEVIPTRTTTVSAPRPAANPLQFVKVGPAGLYRSAQEQLKKVEEVKKIKPAVKDDAEDWQFNLDNWKCSRRKRQEHIIERVVEVKKFELEEHDRNRKRSKTFSEMMEERSSRGRKMSLPVYQADNSDDLSDLGLSSGPKNKNVNSTNSENESSENENSSCAVEGVDSGTGEPEYTYERAIQSYVNFAETRVKSRSNQSLTETESKSADLSSKKFVLSNSESKCRGSARKIEKFSELQQKRSSSSNDLSSSAGEVKKAVSVPKVNISKRRELFEKMSDNDSSEKPSRVSNGDLSTTKTIRERLSSLEKLNEDSKMNSSKTVVESEVSVKERLSQMEKISSSAEKSSVKTIPVKSCLVQTTKEGASFEPKSEKIVKINRHSIITKEIKEVEEEKDYVEASSPTDCSDDIFEPNSVISQSKVTRQSHLRHRSLDSLDVDLSNGLNNETFERVQSLEDLDFCGGNYPASSMSGDTDREDSGIHTADVSSSVSQADDYDLHLDQDQPTNHQPTIIEEMMKQPPEPYYLENPQVNQKVVDGIVNNEKIVKFSCVNNQIDSVSESSIANQTGFCDKSVFSKPVNTQSDGVNVTVLNQSQDSNNLRKELDTEVSKVGSPLVTDLPNDLLSDFSNLVVSKPVSSSPEVNEVNLSPVSFTSKNFACSSLPCKSSFNSSTLTSNFLDSSLIAFSMPASADFSNPSESVSENSEILKSYVDRKLSLTRNSSSSSDSYVSVVNCFSADSPKNSPFPSSDENLVCVLNSQKASLDFEMLGNPEEGEPIVSDSPICQNISGCENERENSEIKHLDSLHVENVGSLPKQEHLNSSFFRLLNKNILNENEDLQVDSRLVISSTPCSDLETANVDPSSVYETLLVEKNCAAQVLQTSQNSEKNGSKSNDCDVHHTQTILSFSENESYRNEDEVISIAHENNCDSTVLSINSNFCEVPILLKESNECSKILEHFEDHSAVCTNEFTNEHSITVEESPTKFKSDLANFSVTEWTLNCEDGHIEPRDFDCGSICNLAEASLQTAEKNFDPSNFNQHPVSDFCLDFIVCGEEKGDSCRNGSFDFQEVENILKSNNVSSTSRLSSSPENSNAPKEAKVCELDLDGIDSASCPLSSLCLRETQLNSTIHLKNDPNSGLKRLPETLLNSTICYKNNDNSDPKSSAVLNQEGFSLSSDTVKVKEAELGFAPEFKESCINLSSSQSIQIPPSEDVINCSSNGVKAANENCPSDLLFNSFNGNSQTVSNDNEADDKISKNCVFTSDENASLGGSKSKFNQNEIVDGLDGVDSVDGIDGVDDEYHELDSSTDSYLSVDNFSSLEYLSVLKKGHTETKSVSPETDIYSHSSQSLNTNSVLVQDKRDSIGKDELKNSFKSSSFVTKNEQDSSSIDLNTVQIASPTVSQICMLPNNAFESFFNSKNGVHSTPFSSINKEESKEGESFKNMQFLVDKKLDLSCQKENAINTEMDSQSLDAEVVETAAESALQVTHYQDLNMNNESDSSLPVEAFSHPAESNTNKAIKESVIDLMSNVVPNSVFPLELSSSLEPPKEKPPPPPTEASDEEEVLPSKSSLRRLDSTKRIKKEIRQKRSSFLGIENASDESFLEPELEHVKPPPDMNIFLQKERRLEQMMYRQSICSESDSTQGESRDSGVELDRIHNDDIGWHQRHDSEPFTGNNSTTSEEEEMLKKESDSSGSLEQNVEKLYKSSIQNDEEFIGEKLALRLRALEQENSQLEWERDDEKTQRQIDELARCVEEHRQQELKQKQKNINGNEALKREVINEQKETWTHMRRSLQDVSIDNYQPKQSIEDVGQMETELRRSLQDVSQESLVYPEYNSSKLSRLDCQSSMPNLQENMVLMQSRRPPPPVPPFKKPPQSSREKQERMSAPQQMSKQTLQALSAVPRSRLISSETWMQVKRKPKQEAYNYQHWLIQEAEHRRITEQNQRQAHMPIRRSVNNSNYVNTPVGNAPPQPINNDQWIESCWQRNTVDNQWNPQHESQWNNNIPTSNGNNWAGSSSSLNSMNTSNWTNSLPSKSKKWNGNANDGITAQGNQWNCGQTQWNPSVQKQEKPLPDSIIQTLTQRVQNKISLSDSNNNANRRSQTRHEAAIVDNRILPNISNENHQEKILSVSGKKKCSYCGEELGRGAAMIIESLRLFYHIDCFKCCVCCVQLGDGMMGTDVRVRNNKLHCHNCYSSDDGVKFSCV